MSFGILLSDIQSLHGNIHDSKYMYINEREGEGTKEKDLHDKFTDQTIQNIHVPRVKFFLEKYYEMSSFVVVG